MYLKYVDPRITGIRTSRRFASLLALTVAGLSLGCASRPVQVAPIEHVPVSGLLTAEQILTTYGTPAFVYREGIPGTHDVRIRNDQEIPADEAVDDRNLIIFASGSGDQPVHFRHTARLLAESPEHPPGDDPHLLIILVHWSETTNVVHEHLKFKAQSAAARQLRHMCSVHQRRFSPSDSFVGIIGFSAGTRITQLAFGAILPQGRRGDKLPSLGPVPPEMSQVHHVVYLGSSVNREDPLPFGELKGRFINYVNYRDTHYGDRAPYFAPAGTSPVIIRVIEANVFLSRPRTGASANGFAKLPTLTTAEQFELLDLDPRLQQAFRMVNVEVPPELVPWSTASLPILDDDLDDHWNRAPNHYTMVGRGPKGRLSSPAFQQYKELTFEFVREHVASAVMRGRVEDFHLQSKPKPSILPTLLTPIDLLLPTEGIRAVKAPTTRSADSPPSTSPGS